MSFTGISQANIRQFSRWVLVLFVISWVNLVIQAPVHAGMKQQKALSGHMNMAHCHCPETLCNTVLNLEAQSSDVVHFILDDVSSFQIAYTLRLSTIGQNAYTRPHFSYLVSIFEAGRPPPLEITRILQI